MALKVLWVAEMRKFAAGFEGALSSASIGVPLLTSPEGRGIWFDEMTKLSVQK